MTKPLGVEIDFESKAGYVTYLDSKVAETVDVWEEGTVAADLDSEGKIVGIEVLGLDPEALSQARAYAQDHDLLFPPHLDLIAS
jgi:uncharacterized protein YuzE